MNAKIIQIGNSKGLRLSKMILKKYNIQDQVEIMLKEDHIVIRPVGKPRAGWEEQFSKNLDEDDNVLLIPDIFEDENIEEWS